MQLALRKRRWISFALLLALPLWLHTYEAAFWRLHLGAPLLAWLGVALGIASWLRVLHRARAPELRWLHVALGLTIAIALFSTATFWVADGDQRHWPDEELRGLGSGWQDLPVVPAGVEVLQCSPELVVFGRARGSVQRFVSTTSGSSPLLLTPGLVPADFEAYAALVEPSLLLVDKAQRPYVIAEDFLRWQFPRHILLVLVPLAQEPSPGEPSGDAAERRSVWGCNQAPASGAVIALEEDNRTGKSGVYPVHPLLKGELSTRLTSYRNFLRYALIGPHDRDDLTDDPYFALLRHGSLDDKLKLLPPERQAFLRRRVGRP